MPSSGKLSTGWARRNVRTSAANACSSAVKPNSMGSLHLVGRSHANHTTPSLPLLDIPAHEGNAEVEGGGHVHGVGPGQREEGADGSRAETGPCRPTRDSAGHLGQRERGRRGEVPATDVAFQPVPR